MNGLVPPGTELPATLWAPDVVRIGEPHEGPKIFQREGHFWMIVDEWRGQGVYRSVDGAGGGEDIGDMTADPRTHLGHVRGAVLEVHNGSRCARTSEAASPPALAAMGTTKGRTAEL